MVKVAIAGTGPLAKHIIEEIAVTKKHEIIVISRSATDLSSLGADIQVVPVSYDDPAALTSALAGVHTVISTIFQYSGTALLDAQLALISAASRAGVSRFAPSEFNVLGREDDVIVPYRPKAAVAAAVRKSGMEYTLFECGLFMNYLGMGTAGLGHAKAFDLVVNVGDCNARVPGSGEARFTLTRLEDVGKFVAASLDMESWPEVSRMAGDNISYNKVVALAEAVRGKKFDITYVSVEELQAEEPNMLQQVLLEIIRGRFDLKDANLNTLLPQIEPMDVEEFLQKLWKAA